VDIADKVNDELQCIPLLKKGDVLFKSAAGVVRNGGDDASFFGAVPLEIDVAGLGWVVERILGGVSSGEGCSSVQVMYNEVVSGTIGTALLVAVAVCPSGYAGQVVVRCVVQEPLSKLDRLASDKVLRNVANGCMP